MRPFLEVDGAAFRERNPLFLNPPQTRRVYTALGVFDLLVRSDLVRGRDGLLLHLAFLADLRVALRVYPERWKVTQGAHAEDREGLEPDALWREGGILKAVEVDLGHYSRKRVEVKLRHYREAYGGQVWGVLGARRAAWLEGVARGLGVPVEVVVLKPPGKIGRAHV